MPRLEQRQPDAPYRLDVEVELRGAGAPERLSVRMEDRVAEVPVESRGAVEIALDPGGWLRFDAADGLAD